MPAKELVQNLPQTTRRYIYSGYAVVGLGLGATQVGYSAAEAGQPTWLVVALAVFAFVGTALGFTAAQNTGAEPVIIEDGDGDHRAEPVTSGALDHWDHGYSVDTPTGNTSP